jgi:glutamyl-tRNA synthetase
MATIITRFAPSPTGYLHVGGARTALFSWLLARHSGGKYFLRIEDTDLARSTEESCQKILEDLTWLGLGWDNQPIMRQSQRLEIYNSLFDDLMKRDLAYKAYETPQELAAQRKIAEQEKRAFVYRRRPLSDEQIRQYESEGRPHVVRFVMPVREYRFHDQVLDKEIVMGPDEVQDFVIRKGDGMPTYHFAVVVDDAAMGITHVLRGQEHLKNTFYHIALQEAFGYGRPVYGHLPIILNKDASKMGKRDQDKMIRLHAKQWMNNTKKSAADLADAVKLPEPRISAWLKDSKKQLDGVEQRAVMAVVGLEERDLPEILVHDFRKNGYLPEVLLNFLALLGWNPGHDRERMSMAEMVELFSMERIGTANAVFGREKLVAFNTEACAAAQPQRLLAAMRDFLAANPDSPLHSADDAALAHLIKMKKGFHTLRDVEATTRFLFMSDEQIAYDPEAIKKAMGSPEAIAILRETRGLLAAMREENWDGPALEAMIKEFCTRKNLGLGKVAQPIRVAVSGTMISPPIFESLAFLGRQRTLARIDRCLEKIG